MPDLPLSKLFVLLFMMMGPLRVVPSFHFLTRELDRSVRAPVALRGALFAGAGVLLAVFCGHAILSSWGASPQALATATGLLLLLTALQSLIGWPQSNPPARSSDAGAPAAAMLKQLALSPLAFPMILPPFAVGVLILFGAYYSDFGSQLRIAGLSLLILLADFIAMRYAEKIMNWIGPNVLQVLGAVFGVLQLSLAIQMIFWGIGLATPNAN